MRRLAETPSSRSRHILYPLFVAVWMLSIVPMASVPAGAEGRDFSHPRNHRSGQCAGLERALGVLEWTQFLDLGRWGALFRARRERAIQKLAQRYADRCVSLNQVQILGTHNSYHIQPDPVLINLYLLFDETAIQWGYTHTGRSKSSSNSWASVSWSSMYTPIRRADSTPRHLASSFF